MITIYFNDISEQIIKQTLSDFLMLKRLDNQHFAIAINQQFLPRSAFNTTWLAEGDRVELIIPMQGG